MEVIKSKSSFQNKTLDSKIEKLKAVISSKLKEYDVDSLDISDLGYEYYIDDDGLETKFDIVFCTIVDDEIILSGYHPSHKLQLSLLSENNVLGIIDSLLDYCLQYNV